MNFDVYTKILQNYLQSRVIIKCENKVLKTGKIKLFNVKQYFIKFYIETDKHEVKVLELPYPYRIDNNAKVCSLNYHLTALCNNYKPIVSMLHNQQPDNALRMYNNIVNIIPID